MNCRWHVDTACIVLVLLMMSSVPIAAGTYDTELAKMAKSVAASFDQTQKIKTIAVLDFTDLQGTVTELGRFVAEELSADLVIGQKQFDVIDRANLKRLLDENKLSRSGLVDPEAIKRLGKMAGADALITGTITPLGNSLRVSARIINTETARIVGAAQGDIDKTPEISELLRARVVEGGDSSTVEGPSAPVESERAPARKVKLTYEDRSFRATVTSAFFDKSANQITVLIDFTNLLDQQAICLAAAGRDAVLAIDEFGGQWGLVKMVNIQEGQFDQGEGRAGWGTQGGAWASQGDPRMQMERKYATWAVVPPTASHRFAVVLAPRKADSPLTLNLTLGLYANAVYGMSSIWGQMCITAHPVQVSVGFDGITAAK